MVPLGVFNSNFGAISTVSEPKDLSAKKYRGYCANSIFVRTLDDWRKRVLVNDRADLEMTVQMVFIHLTSSYCGVTRSGEKIVINVTQKPYGILFIARLRFLWFAERPTLPWALVVARHLSELKLELELPPDICVHFMSVPSTRM